MKRICTLLAAIVAFSTGAFAQNIGINGTGASADPSALLDVSAPNKGLLIPRVALTSTADVTTIAAPATSLLVYNTATVSNVTPGFYYWNGSVWVRFDLNSNDWNLSGNAGTNPATNFIGTTDAQNLIVRTNSGERMRVTSGGLVGIGETAPASILHVSSGDIRVGELYPVNTGTLPGYGRRIHFSGGPTGPSYNSDNSDPIWMSRYNAASDASELRMNLSDNCQSLDAFVIQTGGSGCAANTVYFRFDGVGNAYKLGGGAWLALSDRRLKKDIQPYEEGLSVLQKIRPVTYQYNGEANTPDNGQTYTGVIAQELQEIAPHMVQPYGDYLSVDPSAFTYILINSVQEQQAQIEALTGEKSELEARLSTLEAQMQEIRELLDQEAKR